jgi:hypothetical protein
MNFAQKYLEVTAGITLFIGGFVLFNPSLILDWFIPGANNAFFVRFIGSTLIGYAVLNHRAARQKSREARELAIVSNIATLFIATVISIVGVLNGSITSYQWLIVSEHLVFLGGFIFAYTTN